VATAGSGCTFGGNPNATVPLAFGASCNGAQCTVLAPEPVVNMPCGVALMGNVTIEGVGNPTISTGWDNATANPSQMIAFCEPSGVQSTNITIKNLNFNSVFIGFYFPFEVTHLVMDNLIFLSNVAYPMHVFAFGGWVPFAYNHTYNFVNMSLGDPPSPQSIISNISDYGYSGISCGGEWIGRSSVAPQTAFNGAVGLFSQPGGYQMLLSTTFGASGLGADNYRAFSHYLPNDAVAPCGNVRIENFHFDALVTNTTTVMNNFDLFWDQYVWKSQNSLATPYTDATHLLSNGVSTCKTPLTFASREVDFGFGISTLSTPNNYPFYQCFPGYLWSGFIFAPRYSNAISNTVPWISFTNIFGRSYSTRPLITGKFDALRIDRIQTVSKSGLTDPWLQTSEVRSTITNSTRVSPTARVEDVVGYGGASMTTLLQGLPTTQRVYTRNVSGMLDIMPATVAGGTQTITGCTLSSAVGGSSAGQFTSGAAGTCTATITPGLTAPNGFRCSATNMNTPANAISQTSTTTTTCVISGTTASGDKITWQAIAF
jgi:hypothetical protein